MQPRLFILLGSAAVVAVTPDSLWAQASSEHAMVRGPGSYLAWEKLLLVTVVFLAWVKAADWVNRDSQYVGQDTKMPPEIWGAPRKVGRRLPGRPT